ncbi:MAG TPA: hypothetical protein VLM75_11335 [Spirochaetota bacterium]|nr:hypothetical protein [Spirochaetota bacterium]
MQEALVLIITLAAAVYGIIRVRRMIAGSRECECDRCPVADCAGRGVDDSPDCDEEKAR